MKPTLLLCACLVGVKAKGLKLQYEGDVVRFIKNNTDFTMEAIFQSLDLNHEVSRIGLRALLQNDYVNLGDYLEASCISWTLEQFKMVAKWVFSLPEYDPLHKLLPECAATMEQNVDEAQVYLVEIGMPAILSECPRFSKAQWIKLLNSDDYENLNNWFYIIPDEYLDNDFFNQTKLAKFLNLWFFTDDSHGKINVLNHVEGSLSSLDDHSMTRLLLIWKELHQEQLSDREIVGKIRDVVTQAVARNPIQILHKMTCGIRTFIKRKQFRNKLCEYLRASEMPDVEKFDTLKLWNLVDGENAVSRCLARIPKIKISFYKLLDMVLDFGKSLSLEGRRGYFKNLGYNYDKIVIAKAAESGQYFRKLMTSMELRLKYYRYQVMLMPSLDHHSNSLGVRLSDLGLLERDPERVAGEDATFENVKVQFMEFLEKERPNFVITPGEESQDLISLRPRAWFPFDLFQFMISTMIYSIIEFERPVAIMDLNFCKSLENNTLKVDDDDIQAFQLLRPTMTDAPNWDDTGSIRSTLESHLKDLHNCFSSILLKYQLRTFFTKFGPSICEVFSLPDEFLKGKFSATKLDAQQKAIAKKILEFLNGPLDGESVDYGDDDSRDGDQDDSRDGDQDDSRDNPFLIVNNGNDQVQEDYMGLEVPSNGNGQIQFGEITPLAAGSTSRYIIQYDSQELSDIDEGYVMDGSVDLDDFFDITDIEYSANESGSNDSENDDVLGNIFNDESSPDNH